MGKNCSVDGCGRSAITRGYCEMHYRRVLKTGKPGPPGPLRSIGVCKVDGCDKEIDAKGLCHGHYQRLLRGAREIETPLRGSLDSCQVEECDRGAESKGYCGTHYKRVLAHGDPLADVPIRETEGNGFINHGYLIVPVPSGMRHLSNGDRSIAEHRLVMARHLGRPLSSDEHVHHINGIKTDNRLENLELWSRSHPSGSRIEDLLEYCMTIIERYADEFGFIRTDEHLSNHPWEKGAPVLEP